MYLGEVTGITTTGLKSVTGLTGKTIAAGNYLLSFQHSSFTATSFQWGVRSVLSAIPGTQLYSAASIASLYYWGTRGGVAYTSGTQTTAAATFDFGSTGTAGIANMPYLKWTKV